MMEVFGPMSILLLFLTTASANPVDHFDGKDEFLDVVKRTASQSEEMLNEGQLPDEHMDEHTSDHCPDCLGDIKLTPEQQRFLSEQQSEGSDRVRRKAYAEVFSRWTNGVVPYVIDGSSAGDRTLIENVIRFINSATCISIRPAVSSDPDMISFFKGNGCYSYIGRQGGVQEVSIGSGCASFGIIFHEIGHALSFFHEQSRPDREDYVTVLFDNIQDGLESNFYYYADNVIDTHGIPYDTTSVMHYSSTAFSINRRGRVPTIITRDPLEMPYLGNRAGPTFADLKLLHLVYDCPAQAATNCGPSPLSCTNDGYLLNDCTCACPPEYTGDVCQLENPDYVPRCITRITADDGLTGTISSPNYPLNYDPNVLCQWLITGPTGSTISLTFTEFNLQRISRYTDTGELVCYWDYVEVFSTGELNQDGVRLCDSDHTLPLTIQSTIPAIRLVFATNSVDQYPGFSANYVIDDPSQPITSQTPAATQSPTATTTQPPTTTTTQPPTTTTTQPTTTTTTQPPTTTTTQPPTTTTTQPPAMTTEVFEGSCGGSFTDLVGRFASPRFPNANYPNNQDCTYEITVPIGQRVALSFGDFNVHCSDSIEINLGDGNPNPMDTCGDDGPVGEIISAANTMTVVFTSNGRKTREGFSARYRAVTLSPDTDSTSEVEFSRGRKCRETVDEDEGYIQSNGYPNDYQEQSNCRFTITAPEGSFVELRVHDGSAFEINCEDGRDFLEIDLGEGIPDKLRLCGDEAPSGSYVSMGNVMRVRFRTRRNTASEQGFRASYQTVTFQEAPPT